MIFLRQGGRAGVDVGHAVLLLHGEHMRVAVNQQVARLVRRQVIEVEQMAVGDERGAAVQIKQRVIRHDRELQHHLINLRVAVAAHAEQLVLYAVEQRDHALRVVCVRQIVARTVIEQVAQQNQTLRALGFVGGKHRFAGAVGTVDIGSKHQFHRCMSPFLSYTVNE